MMDSQHSYSKAPVIYPSTWFIRNEGRLIRQHSSPSTTGVPVGISIGWTGVQAAGEGDRVGGAAGLDVAAGGERDGRHRR